MTNHISENTFEKFYVSPEEITEQEKSNIEQHLEECTLCREHLLKLKTFHENLQANLSSLPTERDRLFAEKLLAQKRLALPLKAIVKKNEEALDAYAEVIEPYYRSLPQRIIRYLQIHPVRAAAGFSMAAALVAGALFIARPVKDTNPSYARAKDEFLVVYNSHGDELWRKHIGSGYDWDKLSGIMHYSRLEDCLVSVDVDNDGSTEVIASFGRLGPELKNTIICFSGNGSEKWRYEFHRNMIFGSEAFSDDYSTYMIAVGDFDKDGQVEVIAIENHEAFYPTAVICLDARSGTLSHEYWNSGNLTSLLHWDLDGDGKDEIIAGGENNAYNLAALLVLDSRAISGHAPASPEYSPLNVNEGIEKYYLLFPRNDLEPFAFHKRNRFDGIVMRSDGMEVHVGEEIGTTHYLVYYVLDSSMRCSSVSDTDPFTNLHHKLEAEGKLTKRLDAEYYEDLRKGVRYWDGEKFVNTPTVNKRYFGTALAQ